VTVMNIRTGGSVAADLRLAADLLERDGWAQGTYQSDDGQRCVMGALLDVAGDINFSVHKSIFKQVAGKYPLSYNDSPGRTAEQVITALRAAADKAENL